jgi:hypothetical protein
MKKILFLFLINFIIVTDVLSNESKSEQKDNTWTSRKISLGVGFGFNFCLFQYMEMDDLYSYYCRTNDYGNEISVNIWPSSNWQISISGGDYIRFTYQSYSAYIPQIFINLLTGFSIPLNNFRWYLVGGTFLYWIPFISGLRLVQE